VGPQLPTDPGGRMQTGRNRPCPCGSGRKHKPLPQDGKAEPLYDPATRKSRVGVTVAAIRARVTLHPSPPVKGYG